MDSAGTRQRRTYVQTWCVVDLERKWYAVRPNVLLERLEREKEDEEEEREARHWEREWSDEEEDEDETDGQDGEVTGVVDSDYMIKVLELRQLVAQLWPRLVLGPYSANHKNHKPCYVP
ncbi:hypothetical protein LTR17_020962 [Elasticomyces elasticus]|nr:hypothetical protein LTR17_020962 [Elasticomyces elasticus]